MDPNLLPSDHPDMPNPYALPEPTAAIAFEGIERDAVEIRVALLSWPAHADSTQQKDLSGCFTEAQAVFRDFLAYDASVEANLLLSPAGKLAEKQKWARKILPPLQKKLDKLTDEEVPSLARSLENHIGEYMGRYAKAPTEPNDLQVCGEIRAMLRALPEGQRMKKILALASQGDRMVIQAVMHAPAYLSGVDPKVLREYQLEMTRKALPERMKPWNGRKDALLMTRRALDGVIRCIGAETKLLPELRDHHIPKPAAAA
jgi:hypothetical protein